MSTVLEPAAGPLGDEAGAALAAPLGRVAAPPGLESTSGVFHFWVDRARAVERTQLVTTRCVLDGRAVEYVGIVQEVYRRSPQRGRPGTTAGARSGRRSTRPA